ncbi:hypothetical protein [Millisia brevis]|uniref:hypothetical protein n=1 Tax=Millisia brevis TaxID=264148 RepID=UPI001471A5E5|nr:hypothetical protein [Millisia brevis]
MRLLLAGVLVVMAAIATSLVLGVGPAGAHSVVVTSNPVDGALPAWPFVGVATVVAVGGLLAVLRSLRHAER